MAESRSGEYPGGRIRTNRYVEPRGVKISGKMLFPMNPEVDKSLFRIVALPLLHYRPIPNLVV